MEEVCFPRGGRNLKSKQGEEKRPKPKNLFTINETKKRKKQKVTNTNNPIGENLRLNSADLLAYNKIQPSMIILGCVKDILGVTLKIQLPGTLYADVQLNAISEKLTNQLVKNPEFYQSFNLKSIFNIGDFIPIQILEHGETNDGNQRLIATADPLNINAQNNCNSFRKGMLIWGAVVEKSDHVYSIDLGVQNTRCVLNINDICQGKEYVEGQPLWLLIKSVQSSNNITTVMVTNLESDFNNYTSPVCNLDILCSGSCVEVICTKVLKNGLEVSFFQDCIGYINKIYLDTPKRNTKEFLNTSFKAYVLYKNPITKFTYFTMKSPQNPVTPEYEIGTVLKSKVIDNFPKGVVIQFKNTEVGFVTYKRLIKSLKVKDNADVQDLIKQKYSKGSTYDCRIMDYSFMDRMYICTFEMDIIKEKYFSKSDLKVGEIITGKIKTINRSGILIRVGMVECFVTNEQLTNAQYSENVKLQFKVGKTVKARVLIVDPNSIKLTLKPALLEDHKCLTSYSEAKVHHSYLGVAVFIKQHMVLVKFYNDVKGIILDKGKVRDFTKLLYQGQVIEVTVLSNKNDNLILSLDQSDKKRSSKLCVGETYNGVITNVTPDGLDVDTDGFKGFVPVQHLCADLKLSKIMIEFLKKDQELSKLVCLESTSNTNSLFSIRENPKTTIPKTKTLTPGTIVQSFVNTFDDNGLKLDVFTKKGMLEVVVNRNHIMNNQEVLNKLKLTKGQALLVKITSNVNNKKYCGTVMLSDVLNKDFKRSAIYLQKYLNDLNIIQQLSKEHKTIAAYKMGEKVDVRVKKIADIGCSVELSDGTRGIATKDHMLKNLKAGSMHTARILFVNIADNVLEVSFKPQILNQKFVEGTNLKKGEEVFAKILMIRENFAICSVKHNGIKSFGFIPIKLSENDFSPDYEYYRNKNGRFRLTIFKKTDFGAIGFPSDLVKTAAQNSRKRKLSETNKVPKKKLKLNKNKQDIIGNIDNEEEEIVDNINDEEALIVDGDDCEAAPMVDKDHSEVKEEINSNRLITDLNKEEEDKSSDNTDKDEGIGSEPEMKNKNNEIEEVLNQSKGTVTIEKLPIPAAAKFKNPSMKSFFDTSHKLLDENEDAESESDSDTNADEQPKKKKLTKKEQVELLKKQEEELRKIELTYADMNEDTIPQNADQFDRRLLANPNSSALWIQYAALHISNTEIDKARSVFRRALQSINHTLTEDHLNIWTAYINLENAYGTKQTFKDIFNEAIKYNDDLRVYIHAVSTVSTSQNIHDVDELIEKMVKKFKQELKMYVEVAKVYYKQKRFMEARKLRSKALATIIEKKKHIPLIVQFAKLEFDSEEDEYAETLFETILKDTPQRVDIWVVYVDQLIKKKKIDSARRVLQRAVGQKLKISKMTSLCKKYVAFEKQYGNEETRSTAESILNDIFSNVKNKY